MWVCLSTRNLTPIFGCCCYFSPRQIKPTVLWASSKWQNSNFPCSISLLLFRRTTVQQLDDFHVFYALWSSLTCDWICSHCKWRTQWKRLTMLQSMEVVMLGLEARDPLPPAREVRSPFGCWMLPTARQGPQFSGWEWTAQAYPIDWVAPAHFIPSPAGNYHTGNKLQMQPSQ